MRSSAPNILGWEAKDYFFRLLSVRKTIGNL